jgi:hypothetical protein
VLLAFCLATLVVKSTGWFEGVLVRDKSPKAESKYDCDSVRELTQLAPGRDVGGEAAVRLVARALADELSPLERDFVSDFDAD